LGLLRFFKGGLTYSDLTDRPESGELYEIAGTYMLAWNQAESEARRREEARLRLLRR